MRITWFLNIPKPFSKRIRKEKGLGFFWHHPSFWEKYWVLYRTGRQGGCLILVSAAWCSRSSKYPFSLFTTLFLVIICVQIHTFLITITCQNEMKKNTRSGKKEEKIQSYSWIRTKVSKIFHMCELGLKDQHLTKCQNDL